MNKHLKRATALLLTFVFALSLWNVSPVIDTKAQQELTYFTKTFETGKEAVQVRGTASTGLNTEYAYNGSQSLVVTERGDQQWHGANLDITKYIKAGGVYTFSLWVYVPEEMEFKTSVMRLINGQQGWDDLNVSTVSANTWTEITAEYTVPDDTTKLEWNFETTDNGIGKSFYLDDVKFSAKDLESYVVQETEEPVVDTSLTPLKDIYADDFLIGTIYNPRNLEGLDQEILLHHYNVITPENLMKPESMQNTQGNFSFAAADAMVGFAKEKDLSVIGHTFVWHAHTPDWMAEGRTRAEAMEAMKTHIKEIGERYADDIMAWDVVNEAIADGVSLPADGDWRKCLRTSPWKTAIGDDYIALAFQYAREAAPNAKLYYNDYNLNDYKKAEIAAAMVRDLIAEGVPVDGIGMQAHYNTNLSIETVKNSISLFEGIGVELSITELDVTVVNASSSGLTKAQEIAQAQVYAKLFQTFKQHANTISRVTFWGCNDAQSWRSDLYPCLFKESYAAKEAYYAVADPEGYLIANPVEDIPKPLQLEASYGTPVIDQTVDAIWETAASGNVNIMTTAHNGATGAVKVLWDEGNVYVLMDVTDHLLNASNAEPHNQDSVEIFLDENNGKTAYYEADDGQFRVSFENNVSFGSNGVKAGFESAVALTAKGYRVEMKIPVVRNLAKDMLMGFEVQVNDSNASGERFSVAKFNDDTDNSWQSTQRWGELKLVKEGTTINNNQIQADKVINLIQKIGTVKNTSASKRKIDAARNAYNKLTAAQKKLVTNYSTLKAAEKKYTQLKNEIKKGKVYTVGNYKYKVTNVSKKTVTLTGVTKKSLKTLKAANTVKIKGKTFQVTAIGSSAFKNCSKATKLTIGKNITAIGSSAFSKCKKLKTITIQSKVIKSVGKNAFQGISKKATIKVPSNRLQKYKKLFKNKGQNKAVKLIK